MAQENAPMINRSIYLPTDLVQAVEKMGRAEGHKFNSYVRFVLEQHVALAKAQELVRQPGGVK